MTTLFVSKVTPTKNENIRVGLVQLQDPNKGFGRTPIQTPLGTTYKEVDNPVVDRFVAFVKDTVLEEGDKVSLDLSQYNITEDDYITKDGDVITFKVLELK